MPSTTSTAMFEVPPMAPPPERVPLSIGSGPELTEKPLHVPEGDKEFVPVESWE